MLIATLLVLHIVLGIVFTGEPDPCLETVYRTLNEPQRSANYTAHVTETLMCDNYLSKKWYRFTSDSGGTMPNTCVALFKCGTRMPIWLSGGHPTVTEEIVDRTLCIHYDPTLADSALENECCGYEMTARVKNCGQFFVYELDQVPECPMAYCAGDGQPCPKGQSGFTPSCTDVYPMLADRPLLKGPSIEGDNFYFYCEFPTIKSYNYQKFDVKWTVNSKLLPNSRVTTNETSVKLNGSHLKGYLQSTVGCSVKSYFAITPENASDWIDSSNTYSAEIKIEPSYLVVSEAEEEKKISVKFTLPIICQNNCDPLKLTLKQSGAKGTVSDQCMFSLYPADWNAKTNEARLSLIVKAKRDHVQNDPNRRDMLALEVVNYSGVYNGTIIDPMPVGVRDKEERKCFIWGDPHIKGMEYDKSEYFHLYKTGDYTIYENKNRYFEIQIRTFICNRQRRDRSVTCICAVAIREFNDLIIIDNCNFLNISLCGSSPTIKKFKKSNPATSVQRRRDGMEFGVYLPSGTEVKIQQSSCWLDVNVIIPSVDNGTGRGICGTFDGVPNNEFIYRNSTLQETCDNSNSECNPEGFLESWRNYGVKSLFGTGEPGKVTDNRTQVYCSCGANNGAQCSVRKDIPNIILQCTGYCPTVVSDQRKKKSTDESVSMDQFPELSNPFDPDKSEDFNRANVNWPTPSGITEQEAESRCRSAIQTSQLWSLCNTMINIDSDYLEGCKLDIKYTDSFGAMETYINGFTTECQYIVATNSSNYIVDENGENVLKAEFAVVHEVCTLECLKNGRCQKGVCVCNSSFTGSNCQLSKEHGPQLREIYGSNSSSGVCDRSKTPCRRTFIMASNYEYSDNLACKVQDLSTSTATIEDAEYINNQIVACTLPGTQTTADCSTIDFVISVTMDGVLYGNSIKLRVFSTDCELTFGNAAPEIFQNPLLIALFVFLFLKRFL